jgi:hypothetical protein
MGPIDRMWEHFKANHTDGLSPAQEANSKLLFFMATTMTYNFMIDTMRKDTTFTLLAIVTESMRLNIERYFDGDPQPELTQKVH